MDSFAKAAVIKEGFNVGKGALEVKVLPKFREYRDKTINAVKFLFRLPKNLLSSNTSKEITINGKVIKFILPEKFTRLGFGDELKELYRERGNEKGTSKLYIDDEMNIYEMGKGKMFKIFANGEFLAEPEEVNISIVEKGIKAVNDFLNYQESLINDPSRPDFVSPINIFPAETAQKAEGEFKEYRDNLFGWKEVETLPAANYNKLTKRLQQERQFERDTNARFRGDTDKYFANLLSIPEARRGVIKLYEYYKQNKRITPNSIFAAMGRRYFEEFDPHGTGFANMEGGGLSNPYVDALDFALTKASYLSAPSMKQIAGKSLFSLGAQGIMGGGGATAVAGALITTGSTLAIWLFSKLFGGRGNPSEKQLTSLEKNLIDYQKKADKVLDYIQDRSILESTYKNAETVREAVREGVRGAIQDLMVEVKKQRTSQPKPVELVSTGEIKELDAPPLQEHQLLTLPEDSDLEEPVFKDVFTDLNEKQASESKEKVLESFNPPKEYYLNRYKKTIKMPRRLNSFADYYNKYKDYDDIQYLKMRLGALKKERTVSAQNERQAIKNRLAILESPEDPPTPLTNIAFDSLMTPVDTVGFKVEKVEKAEEPNNQVAISRVFPNISVPPIFPVSLPIPRPIFSNQNGFYYKNVDGQRVWRGIVEQTPAQYTPPPPPRRESHVKIEQIDDDVLEETPISKRPKMLEAPPQNRDNDWVIIEGNRRFVDNPPPITVSTNRIRNTARNVWEFLKTNRTPIGLGTLGVGAGLLAAYGIKKGVEYLIKRRRKSKKNSSKRAKINNKK